MEIILYTFLVFFIGIFLFLIIEYPYHIAGLVVIMMVYRINIETPLPLDARGILTLLLFLRLYFFNKENAILVNNYLFQNKLFWFILIFSLLPLIMPIANSEKFTNLLKDIILNLIVLVIGFLILIDHQGKRIFKFSIILVGFVSALDLLYTYAIGAGLNVVRIVDIVLGKTKIFNHNYPGMLTGLGILFVYLMYVRKEFSKIILFIVGLFLFSGLFISTSRSSLLGLTFTFILMNFIEKDLKEQLGRFIKLSVSLLAFIIIFGISYNAFLKHQVKSQFVDKVYYRLIDEPLQMLGLSASESFDKYSKQKREGSMTFRIRKWTEDFDKFQNLKLSIKLFGLGPEKYTKISRKQYRKVGRFAGNVRRQLAAHNGYLIILVERGVLGLFFYLLIILSVSFSSFRVIKNFQLQTPVIYLYLFIVTYSFAQNAELLSIYSFLLLGGVLGNNYSANKYFESNLEQNVSNLEIKESNQTN